MQVFIKKIWDNRNEKYVFTKELLAINVKYLVACCSGSKYL
jgi:hypothetical protein